MLPFCEGQSAVDFSAHENNVLRVCEVSVVGHDEVRAGVCAVGLVFEEGGEVDLMAGELQEEHFDALVADEWKDKDGILFGGLVEAFVGDGRY